MARTLLPDALRDEIAPLFPPGAARPKGGRPRIGRREALTGILFVPYPAIGWERLDRLIARLAGRLAGPG